MAGGRKTKAGAASKTRGAQEASTFGLFGNALCDPLGNPLAGEDAPSLPTLPDVPNLPASPKPHFHGHRARLRTRFDEGGAGALADYELLELVLFRFAPRRDTKPLAKALIARFGDLAGVLAADPAQIAAVDGAGPAIAADLNALHALFVRASQSELRKRPVISAWSSLIAYLQLALQHQTREQFRVLHLDVKNQLISDDLMGEGTIDHAPVYPREIARAALGHGSASLILVHNHPSGDPKPSSQDIAITKEIVAAVKLLGIGVHDHVIVGRQGVASLRQLGLL